LTKLLKLLTKYAYIEIAISGKSFFGTAGRATGLLAQSFLRLLVTDWVSDFVLFAGKLLIAGITGLVAYAVFITGGERFALQFLPSAVALVVIEAFVVAHVFMRVYRLVIDAVGWRAKRLLKLNRLTLSTCPQIFLCLCEDLDRNDGDPDRIHMSSGLKRLATERRIHDKAVEPTGQEQATGIARTAPAPEMVAVRRDYF
jgi:hypothetical protein